MAAVSAVISTGVLGSSIASTYTALGIEYAGLFFRNSYTAAASSFAVRMWYSGTADRDMIFNTTLATGESIYVQQKMRSADQIYASAGTGSAISWFYEIDRLS